MSCFHAECCFDVVLSVSNFSDVLFMFVFFKLGKQRVTRLLKLRKMFKLLFHEQFFPAFSFPLSNRSLRVRRFRFSEKFFSITLMFAFKTGVYIVRIGFVVGCVLLLCYLCCMCLWSLLSGGWLRSVPSISGLCICTCLFPKVKQSSFVLGGVHKKNSAEFQLQFNLNVLCW